MFRHKVVQGLADLIEKYGGKSDNFMINAFWMGFKGQVPMLLQTLDSNEEAVAEIEKKLREMLDIPEPVVIEVVEVKLKKAKKAKAEESNAD